MHPTDEQLQAWLDGESDVFAGDGELLAHLEGCARCQQVLEGGRFLGDAVRLWADERAQAPADDLADRVLKLAANGTAPAAVAQASAPPAATAAVATVTPLASRRRKWLWVAAPTALAAAAAAVFALVQAPRATHPYGEPGGVASGHAPAQNNQLAQGSPRVATTDPGGSEVLAVDPGGEHTTYSVMEVEGVREGTTLAVVWIEDEPSDEGSQRLQ